MRDPRIVSLILFLAGAMTACTKAGPPVKTDVEVKGLLEHDWQEIVQKYPLDVEKSGSIAWGFRVTPPLPVQWPLGPERKVAYYAYPEGVVLHGGDCLVVGKPWARVIVAANSQSAIRILRHSIVELGPQGFRPLASEEVAVARASTAGPMRLRELSSIPSAGSDDARVVRDYYCGWIEGNGVIASQLESRHVDFFSWLDCSSWKPVHATEAEQREDVPNR